MNAGLVLALCQALKCPYEEQKLENNVYDKFK